jgi:hypothetical protein
MESSLDWTYPPQRQTAFDAAAGILASRAESGRRGRPCEIGNVPLTLSDDAPRRRVVVSATQRNLYARDAEGKPAQNYYPSQTSTQPVGTMYESDFSQFQPNGKRVSYTRQLFPLTDRVVRETSSFARVGRDIPAPPPAARCGRSGRNRRAAGTLQPAVADGRGEFAVLAPIRIEDGLRCCPVETRTHLA